MSNEMIQYWVSIVAGLVSAVGCGYLIAAMLLVGRFARNVSLPPRTSTPGVTILKPLHGARPGLLESLASFCIQNYPGEVQIIFGVQDPKDPAVALVERLRAEHPGHLDLVIDTTMHGLNHKVSNLVNMSQRIEHGVVVVADDDIRVDPDHISRVVAALEHRSVGAVTCLYHGVAAPGMWGRLAALGINAHFLPGVVVGLTLDLAHPCFGSTIALKRETLSEIGGFTAVADHLADDYAIGAALRARGYEIAVLPVSVGHMCEEMSAHELWQHEVRWARTIRSIDPLGYAGSIVTHAFPLALVSAIAGIGAGSLGLAMGAVGLGIAAVALRSALLGHVQRGFGLPPQSYWLVPLRDVLSLLVFLSGAVGRDAGWKGRRYRFASGGILRIARS